MRYFTSDTHFGHARIIELCNRPFKDVDHMNAEITQRFNEVLKPGDTLVHLGDVALGNREESLKFISALNAEVALVPGNHDNVSSLESEARRERFMPLYKQHFAFVFPEHLWDGTGNFGRLTMISHYPPAWIPDHGEDRYPHLRPADRGDMLFIHGHSHSNEKIQRHEDTGSIAVHVGVDAWGFYPVSEEQILELL